MAEAFIGSYIRQRREDLGLSQQQLCEGICGPTTMSRLENGVQTPSRNVVNTLLQRLGLPSDRYLALLNRNEIEINALREEIRIKQLLCQHAVEPEKSLLQRTTLGLILELEQLCDPGDSLTRQFILRYKSIVGRSDGKEYSSEERLAMFFDAIRITVPRFETDKINNFLYCLEEIKIINSIANIYEDLEQWQTAFEIYSQLIEYIQNHCQEILHTQGHLPMIAQNYARGLNICGQNEKALEIAELGRQACIQYRNYQLLPRLIHTMAIIHHDLGHHDTARAFYKLSYDFGMFLDDQNDIERVRIDARKDYGMEFPLTSPFAALHFNNEMPENIGY